MRRLFFLLLFLLAAPITSAQDESGIAYGSTLTGRLTDTDPRAVYYFEGLRGEVVSITMRVTDGDLDPVLTVLDNRGQLVATLDDSASDKTPVVEALTLPQTDRYYVVVGRFGYALGTTSGGYELAIQRVSVSSESGSQLRYGDSIINRITDMQPQLYYTFHADQGDIVNIRMRRVSGDLDPYLQVVQVRQGNAFVVADNDDLLGAATPFDAAIEGLVIEESDTYVVIASRYGQASGTSSGNFLLVIEEARNSGLGNSVRAPYPLQFGNTVEGELTDSQFVRYYRFDAEENDIISVRMERVGGRLDSFLVLADENLQELATDDDSGGGQNAFIAQYLVPTSGTYYIIATRFDRDNGTTSGNYRLQLQSLGNAFDGVPEGYPRMAYGSTITGYIDSQTQQVTYVFWGEEDDIISISMNRGDGNLDPVVTLLDADQQPLVSNDDGGGGQNARIAAYTIPSTGPYFIRAERYSGEPPGDPNTSGSFILVLARRFN
ncbi:MAG: hypothetical protein K8L99_12320 [Anaerolineae bacterium]|nr:hypothetical protein [Anaerolineae bacterium]